MAWAQDTDSLVTALLDTFGQTATIILKDGGSYQLRVCPPGRRNVDRLTEGMSQNVQTVVIDKGAWDLVIPREPDIADRIDYGDRTVAITEPATKGAGASAVAYKCTIKG